ncbi:hypothetical protein RJ641_003790 [Dillenia turbinata]|uniref:Uncharacterized protein n=1 Tax=Dillenia turbinata TaxID=194707 RepID=A0AAN8VH62_9MAGN
MVKSGNPEYSLDLIPIREDKPMPRKPLIMDDKHKADAKKEVRAPSEPGGHKLAKSTEKGRSLNCATVSATPEKQRANVSLDLVITDKAKAPPFVGS